MTIDCESVEGDRETEVETVRQEQENKRLKMRDRNA